MQHQHLGDDGEALRLTWRGGQKAWGLKTRASPGLISTSTRKTLQGVGAVRDSALGKKQDWTGERQLWATGDRGAKTERGKWTYKTEEDRQITPSPPRQPYSWAPSYLDVSGRTEEGAVKPGIP